VKPVIDRSLTCDPGRVTLCTADVLHRATNRPNTAVPPPLHRPYADAVLTGNAFFAAPRCPSLRTGNPISPLAAFALYTSAMDAMHRMLASMSPDDTAAALRLLRLLAA
jgi:hypothetical protein